jgi:signal peptidase
VFIVAFLLHIINGTTDGVFGYTARIVASGSMEPEVKVNSLTIIKKCDIKDIKENDIICFNYSQDVVHRVIEIATNESGITVLHTKGDANEKADDIEVYDDMLVGKVVHTFNNLAPIIAEYSVSPGEIDGVTLSRNIVTVLVIFGLVLFIAAWIASLINIIIKSFVKEDNLDKNIDKYLQDIDELLLYREMLKQLKEYKVENSKDNKLNFINNRIARAKAEVEMKNLHYAIKDFKKSVKHCMYINKLGDKLNKHNKK